MLFKTMLFGTKFYASDESTTIEGYIVFILVSVALELAQSWYAM